MGKADSPKRDAPGSTLGLKQEKDDPEISLSKDSLKDVGMFAGLKKTTLTVSRESLRSRDSGTAVSLKEVPSSGLQATKDITNSLTNVDLNKDNRERSGPSKSLQDSAEGSTESLQAPVSHQQVSAVSVVMECV